jgi:protein-S-isoprenylcysteine O-methyltransferase Ste14
MAAVNLAKRALRGIAWLAVVLAILTFAPAWSLDYWQGWTFLALFTGCCLAMTLYLLRYDPALVERRMRSGPGAEREWRQKVIMAVVAALFYAMIITPSLDHRFGWSPTPAVVVVVGDCLIVLGFAMILRVFRENSFASATIEVSAGQTLVSTGPYALVRHPMYAAGLPLLLGIPMALGSWWGLAPAALFILAMVWRLLEEERYLARNLAGYQAYCRKVRWRLAPGVW